MARKKTYYLPGLISLVGLPVIFLFFIPPDKPVPVQLKFYLPSDRMYEEGLLSYSKFSVLREVKNKKQVTVQLWHKDTTELAGYRNAAKFDHIRRQIEKLRFEHDTNSVLKIELGDAVSYADFVHLVNLMLIYDLKRYALADNTFYVFANEPPPNPLVPIKEEEKVEIFKCGTISLAGPRGNMNRETISLANLSNRKLLLLSGFVMLILIPGFFRVKKYYFKGMPGFRDNAEI